VIKEERRRAGAFGLATVLAVAAYHLSVFGILFLMPLEWIRHRQGSRSFLRAAVLAAAGIAAVEAGIKALTGSAWTSLDTVGMALPLVLIVGWLAIVEMERSGWRFLYRLLTVTAVTGLVLFPVIAWLLSQPAFNQVVENAFDEVWTQVFQAPGLDVQGLTGKLDRSQFFELLKQAFLGSLFSVLFLFWAVTGWLSRALEPGRARRTLKDFFVPRQGAWILLGLWGLILAKFLLALKGVDWNWGGFEYVVANAAFIVLVVHVAAGWGVLHVLMERAKLPRWAQALVRVLLIVLLVTPMAGTWLVLGGLAMLAVLELWVDFRKQIAYERKG